jgi:3-oxoacyl-[acyl-carrier protein] reductase
MKLLDGRVAIITGSTGGNGRAIANLFSENGANVIITGRNQTEVQKVADEIRIQYKTNPLGFKADVTSLSEVKEMVAKTLQKYNRIDILVNNAGFPINDELWDVRFDEINDADLERVLDVDTKGTYRCSREVLPIMVKQKGGAIITISSTPAIGGYTKGAPYTVAKAANLGITKHIAAEYGKYNIRCNAIAPGNIATPRNWERLTDKEKKELVATIPLGRAGKPEEIAGVALMLASDYASFVNGQTVIVDGGETIR